MNKFGRTGIQVLAVVVGVAAFAPAACGPNMQSVGIDLRHRLLLLEPGLARDSVDTVMGTDSVRVTSAVYAAEMVASPFIAEAFDTDGDSWDVLYYLTFPRNNDGVIDNDELTPLVLRNDVLQGWGWDFLFGVRGQGHSPERPSVSEDSGGEGAG